jgi:hypothetical protein
VVTAARFRKLALALPEASEAPHFDRAAFRTPRRIFATLAKDGRTANLMLDRALQAAAVETRPHAFSALPNKWGDKGATEVNLAAVSEADLVAILAEAHGLSAASRSGRRPR